MSAKAIMGWLVPAVLVGALALRPDVPPASRWRSPSPAPPSIPPGQTLPVVPETEPANRPQGDPKPARADRLQPESRLALVRYIGGEFAHAVRPLPSLKSGYRVAVGAAVDEQALRQAVGRSGAAANPGDTVQVTKIEFHPRDILLDINGGAREKKRWRDRIQIGIAGAGPAVVSNPGATSSTPGYQRTGATLIFDFGRPVPDMTPEEFKQHIAGFLDFSKQRSAAVQWVETLPAEFQQAIKEKRAVVGMDRDMVIAALGRPEQKIRERDPDGTETEDWVYGQPPGKTVFVKFAGDKVIAVREFP